MEDLIIYGEGTNFITSTQTTDIYLEDYTNNSITKQNLIDLILAQIFDTTDGDILRHTNNVLVDITRNSDNVIISEIITEGFYDIRMSVTDSDSNTGTIYWKNLIESLDTDVLTLLVRENKAPVITLNNIRTFNLADFMPTYTIERTNFNNQLVNVVLDDRDGIIVTDILNVKIFQNGADGGTNAVDGTNFILPTYPDGGTAGTSGTTIIEIVDPAVEILFVDAVGEYTFRLTVTDSDSATTVADFRFNVYN